MKEWEEGGGKDSSSHSTLSKHAGGLCLARTWVYIDHWSPAGLERSPGCVYNQVPDIVWPHLYTKLNHHQFLRPCGLIFIAGN